MQMLDPATTGLHHWASPVKHVGTGPCSAALGAWFSPEDWRFSSRLMQHFPDSITNGSAKCLLGLLHCCCNLIGVEQFTSHGSLRVLLSGSWFRAACFQWGRWKTYLHQVAVSFCFLLCVFLWKQILTSAFVQPCSHPLHAAWCQSAPFSSLI